MNRLLKGLRAATGLLRNPPAKTRRDIIASITPTPGEPANAIVAAEWARPDNFFAAGYLLANLDLQKACGSSEAAARDHFERHGHAERRLQITRGYLEHRERFFAEKFALFRAALSDRQATGFPAVIGGQFCDLENYETESANGVAAFFTDELASNPDRLYADIGAGLRNIVYRNCAYVEVYPSLTTDIVIEPRCALPFETASLDGIGCFAVLEHVDQPWKMAEEFARVVKPGGKIFIDWPFLQPVHGYPSHYFNATREGLRSLFAPWFETHELYTGPHEGPNYTVHWIVSNLAASIGDADVRDRFLDLTVRDLLGLAPTDPAWAPILAALDDAAISRLSCGNTLVAQRK